MASTVYYYTMDCRTEHQNKVIKISSYLRKWWPNIVFVRGTDAEYIAESLAAVRGCGYEGAALSWDVMRAPESHLQAIADPAADG